MLARKLKALKADLKVWNKEVFGNLARPKKKKLLLDELWDLDLLKEERALGEMEKVRKVKAISDSEMSTLMEEMSWRQKSRAL